MSEEDFFEIPPEATESKSAVHAAGSAGRRRRRGQSRRRQP